MSPQWTSVLGALFVIMAGVQVWLMLEVTGRVKPKFNPSILSRIHRINGYLFLTLYLIFLYIMINKVAAANSPLDTKTIIHMTLACTSSARMGQRSPGSKRDLGPLLAWPV